MAKSKFKKDHYLKWYESMLLMRKFEERAGQLYGMQKIKGFCHLYIGQEAVVAGAMTVLTPEDNMITAYRDHAHALAKGVSARAVMAELYGKATGCSKGKGGSMHMFDAKARFFGGHGIVGGQIPLGAGIAFADKFNGNKNVTVCYMGDGAVRQGAFHEALNMAMNWKLPVVFVVENNQYAMGTSVKRTANHEDIYKLGLGYEMPCMPVDAMDPEKVAEVAYEAIERARRGDGPTFIEARTYRFRGHSMSDAEPYRTKEEVAVKKEEDPIVLVKNRILENKWATEEELDAIEQKYRDFVDVCEAFAEESPYPTLDKVYEYVYSEPNYPFIDKLEN